MKFTKYFMPLAAVALLASCSNDKLDGPNTPLDPADLLTGGKMYTNINIALPTGVNSRAEGDSFLGYDDGDDSEYGVYNGKLLVFLGPDSENANEDDFTYVASGNIVLGDWAEGVDPNLPLLGEITSQDQTATVVIEGFDKNAIGAKFYGLVILNYVEADMPLPTQADPDSGVKAQTFGSWKKSVLTNSTVMQPTFDGDPYFTMTNAPEKKGTGVDAKVMTLRPLDKSEIYTTSEFSRAENPQPAAHFYVQRGVAKVKIDKKSGNFDSYPVTNTNYADAKVNLKGWVLDVTNTKTYPVQVYEWGFGSAPYSGENFAAGSTTFNRIFWGLDPNYDATGTRTLYNPTESREFNYATANSVFTPLTGEGAKTVGYCLENTMNYGSQYQDQTTRVVFKANFLLDGSTEKSFIEYNGKALEVLVEDLNHDYYEAYPASGEYLLGNLIRGDEPEDERPNEGWRHLSKFTRALGADDNGNSTVKFYQGGSCYYVGRIRHFSDAETDWTAQKPKFELKEGEEYETYTAKQLGRYGVLRNNSYELVVNTIKGPGVPTFPTPDPDDPDDEVEKDYEFVLDINILSWAKRSQNLDW